jgi:endonuclease/exonuclease/phosphatase family metal-dependent hydrolase
MTTPRVKVLTYNIHKGYGPANWSFALHEIRSRIELSGADIVFLQEIHGLHVQREAKVEGWPKGSQFEFLAERAWPHHAYGKNAIYKAGHHGNAILSRYPFESWENINVSRYTRASRSILHGVIRVTPHAAPLHVLCVHFDFVPHQRKPQVDALARRIQSHIPAGEPLIVAGDFNDWEGQVTDGLGPDAELTEVFLHLRGRHARTFPAWLPALPLDRIYYRGLDPLHCRRMRDRPARRLSDHLALYAEFSLPHASGKAHAHGKPHGHKHAAGAD